MSELIDNRANRIRTLKHIITRLHEGGSPDEVRAQLAAIVRETDATEVAEMEQQLIADGMSVDQVRSMCDLHAQVLREVMTEPKPKAIAPGHPVDTFRRENDAIGKVLDELRAAIAQIAALDAAAAVDDALTARVRQGFNDLMDVDKHYQRKENLLFSCLERHGVSGPSKVMWAKDDEARELLKAFGNALGKPHATTADWQRALKDAAEPALQAVGEMVYKENKILLPMALETLSDDEWAEIHDQSPEYGWCLVEPQDQYRAPDAAAPEQPVDVPRGGAIVFPTGSLTYAQLRGLFATLPVDVTFVDADDRVAYFSEGPDRVFARSKAIVGRAVQHCHPPKSVHIVEQILADFRAGRQDVAEFWIELGGRFIHIRYFAVRDEQAHYLGTLEVTQDATHVRTLKGERRLLQYDSPAT